VRAARRFPASCRVRAPNWPQLEGASDGPCERPTGVPIEEKRDAMMPRRRRARRLQPARRAQHPPRSSPPPRSPRQKPRDAAAIQGRHDRSGRWQRAYRGSQSSGPHGLVDRLDQHDASAVVFDDAAQGSSCRGLSPTRSRQAAIAAVVSRGAENTRAATWRGCRRRARNKTDTGPSAGSPTVRERRHRRPGKLGPVADKRQVRTESRRRPSE